MEGLGVINKIIKNIYIKFYDPLVGRNVMSFDLICTVQLLCTITIQNTDAELAICTCYNAILIFFRTYFFNEQSK